MLNVFTGARMLTYLSLAQYNAAVAALKANDRGEHPSIAAAVGGASAALLSAAPFFPARAAFFEGQLDAQEAGARWPGEAGRDFAAGEALGRQIAAAVLARVATDGFTPSNAGVTVPVCPGCWFSAPGLLPVVPRLGEMRTFFLTSGSQFRPPAPPAFGSAEFIAALAEVRQISDTRTPEQDASAKFWAVPNGFAVIPANNYLVATELIVQHHLNEVRAAHTLALMGMASMDAFIACHDAKYTYWLIRPSQADAGISLSVPLPNFPSYPSNHACVTGASMAVLASLFPSEASRLNGLADEAALSRLLGGIHYRFDNNTGLVLGGRVAAWALAHDVAGHAAYALQ
ncbi:MAG TPA: vanadium-dependent haloperoxidase [Candidatus Polarisedimenticolia bacterium]|nr:vanadium-dependent haloperoxidase [Candidatus Polarisedimenticolia bacterium]